MAEHDITTLYSSDLFQIVDFRCSGHDTPRGDEEVVSDYEIVFPRAGVYTRRDSNGTATGDPNHILFFHPDQPFQIQHPICCRDCSLILSVSENALFDIASTFDRAVVDKPDKLFPSSMLPVDKPLRLIQQQLLEIALGTNYHDSLALDEWLLFVLGAIMAAANQQTNPQLAYTSWRTYAAHAELVDEVKLIINTQFRDKLTLDSITKQVNHSPFSLARIFKQHTGFSIHQYLIRIRLFHALDALLECPHESISQIAVRIGFASPSHLSTAFSAMFETTPSAFRGRASSLAKVREMSKILEV